MKICVLATSYPRHKNDHASVFVHGLSKGIANAGHDVHVIVPHEKGLLLKESFDGVTIHRFRYFWPQRLQQVAYGFGMPENVRRKFWAKIGLPFFSFFFFLKAFRIVKGFDVIHAHWEVSGLIAALLSRWRKIPCVLTVHRLVTKKLVMRSLTKWLFRNTTEIHFNSTYTKSEALRILQYLPSHKIIYPSIDVDFFKPDRSDDRSQNVFRKQFNLNSDVFLILGLGRLVEKKGFTYLLQAFEQLSQKNQFENMFLIFGGGGPLLDVLRERVTNLNLSDRVFFSDFLKPTQVREILHASDMIVVPSIEDSKGEVETLGVVSMEAMAAGIPVIASDIGGIPDVVEHGKTGILIPPRDVGALVLAITEMMKNKEKTRILVDQGLRSVREKFSWEKAVGETIAAYENIKR